MYVYSVLTVNLGSLVVLIFSLMLYFTHRDNCVIGPVSRFTLLSSKRTYHSSIEIVKFLGLNRHSILVPTSTAKHMFILVKQKNSICFTNTVYMYYIFLNGLQIDLGERL